MAKVFIEVEEGTLLWAEFVMREGKRVTHKELEYQGDFRLLYLEYDGSEIYLKGIDWDDDICFLDYRKREDLPKEGYELIDIREFQLGEIDSQIQSLQLQIEALELKKIKLNELR